MARPKELRLRSLKIKHGDVPVFGGGSRASWTVEAVVNQKSTAYDHTVTHYDWSNPTDFNANLVILNSLLSTVLKEAEDLSK